MAGQNLTVHSDGSSWESSNMTEKATFGAGCFWGVESAFREVNGVRSAAVGYAGGHFDNPTYQDVCTGATGHAEVVEVDYDPAEVSYEQLLDVFWGVHDPTTLDRQGPDIGTQYRSAVFFHTPEQEAAARASKTALESNGRYKRPIVTEITPAPTFYRAEDYHQQYFEKRGIAHCRM
jgi:peptide-methionine (S)-S-oxide reductase